MAKGNGVKKTGIIALVSAFVLLVIGLIFMSMTLGNEGVGTMFFLMAETWGNILNGALFLFVVGIVALIVGANS